MKILTIDVGTGTQDIFLYDSEVDPENCFKLVLPSPTMILRWRIQEAQKNNRPVFLTGVTMGGGPSAWAAEDMIRSGLEVYATPDAARTFNDDLDAVAQMGVHLVSEDESLRLPPDVLRLVMGDFDFEAIQAAFARFDVRLGDLDAAAVAVFDHGAASAHISDRKFRFDYLDERIRSENRLSAFAYRSDAIPPSMTRLAAVRSSASNLDAELMVMDTAPAAILGACVDPVAASRQRVLVANIGNFHTLAFRLGPQGIEGLFEHHTGLLNQAKLERLIYRLADGSLTNAEVFDHNGHGALVYNATPLDLNGPDYGVVVTGPRRAMLNSSTLRPYTAVPIGDMMIAGCVGLLCACADLLPGAGDKIDHSLSTAGIGRPPWEVQ